MLNVYLCAGTKSFSKIQIKANGLQRKSGECRVLGGERHRGGDGASFRNLPLRHRLLRRSRSSALLSSFISSASSRNDLASEDWLWLECCHRRGSHYMASGCASHCEAAQDISVDTSKDCRSNLPEPGELFLEECW